MLKVFKSLFIFLFSTIILFSQTSEQIKNAKEYIEKSGMSKNEVIKAAKSRGYSDGEINSAIKKAEVTDIKTKQVNKIETSDAGKIEIGVSNNIEKEINSKQREELDTYMDETLEIVDEMTFFEESIKDEYGSTLNYFGYDIFQRDPGLFQATSVGSIDPDYLIGPGDEIICMLWGETQFRQVLSVDREGYIFIPEIGQVFVNGLNLNLLESKLFRVFSQSYQSLNPQNRKATTFLDVSLGNLRPLRIQVLGEVSQPGAYTVSPSTTLFSSLYYFNGPTTFGSLRDIKLIRAGKELVSVDFYDYLLTGTKPKDQKLQLDDVIFIPPRLKTIAINGAVKRPGIYELKQNENFENFLGIIGGLKNTAYLDRCQVDRVIPFENREETDIDRMYVDINLNRIINGEEEFALLDGDRINIFSITDMRQNVVEIYGAVTRPGRYDLGDSLKISELINKADGLLGDAYLERADVIRTKPDLSIELIKVNLKSALKGDLKNDLQLKGSDKVQVYGKMDMISTKYVSIIGHVQNPGQYTLQDNLTLYDLIFKAGGFLDQDFKNQAHLDRAELIRMNDGLSKKIIPFNLDLVLSNKSIADTILKSGDVVRIYSAQEIEGNIQYVTISGHVKVPGRYELYSENMRFSDLVFKAGGFEDLIFKSQTMLSRADIYRYEKNRINKKIIKVNLGAILEDEQHEENIFLMPEDEIKIYSKKVFNLGKSVSIDGIINYPGRYDFKSGMTLKDLILESGGLQENVYRYRVEVARIDSLNENLNNYATSNIFNIDKSVSIGDSSSNKDLSFELKPFDLVFVRKDPFFRLQQKITIEGEVLYPGDYTILNSDEKISDIIKRAGGLLPNAYAEASKYFRGDADIKISLSKIIKNPRSHTNFKVQNGDKLFVAPKPNLVFINGQVNKSGIHKYLPNKRLRFYLKLAGGLNPDADKGNIWVEYPNGDSKKYNKRSLFSPKIIDGSIINVGKKKEEEPLDRTEYAKELTSILANLAQVVTVVLIARN